jgi:transcriptional regulator with XRE-family HTH domain
MARKSKTSARAKASAKTNVTRKPVEADFQLGERVRALRHARGLSLADFGTHLGLSQQQCQKYETGANRISVGMMIRMADVFGVAPSELIAGLGSISKGDAALSKLRQAAIEQIMRIEKTGSLESAFIMLESLNAGGSNSKPKPGPKRA